VSDESVILPRSTRTINLNPVDWSSGESKEPAYTLTLPMHIRGSLQYLGGGSIKVDQVLR
ncbi:MAG: hypothetical protein OEV31_09505, partial [Gammaproteobacteria bacterium]|nr:hypothetical protein [Gammaproteobacteria bacterium]